MPHPEDTYHISMHKGVEVTGTGDNCNLWVLEIRSYDVDAEVIQDFYNNVKTDSYFPKNYMDDSLEPVEGGYLFFSDNIPSWRTHLFKKFIDEAQIKSQLPIYGIYHSFFHDGFADIRCA